MMNLPGSKEDAPGLGFVENISVLLTSTVSSSLLLGPLADRKGPVCGHMIGQRAVSVCEACIISQTENREQDLLGLSFQWCVGTDVYFFLILCSMTSCQ